MKSSQSSKVQLLSIGPKRLLMAALFAYKLALLKHVPRHTTGTSQLTDLACIYMPRGWRTTFLVSGRGQRPGAMMSIRVLSVQRYSVVFSSACTDWWHVSSSLEIWMSHKSCRCWKCQHLLGCFCRLQVIVTLMQCSFANAVLVQFLLLSLCDLE